MFPELFRVPWLDHPVAGYGVLLAAGILVAMWTGVQLAGRDGLDRRRAYDLALATVGASLVGSKALLLVTEPHLLAPDRFFSRELWSSGGVYYGGFLGAVAGSLLFARVYDLPWIRVADAFAPAIALGQAIGRVGCFAAGCCWGTACELPWGVAFPEAAHATTGVPAGVPLHPVQLYESALTLAIFGALLAARRWRPAVGTVFSLYLVLYGAARFTLEIWRDDPRGDMLGVTTLTGLSTSQLIALGCMVAGLAFWAWRRSHADSGAEPTAAPASS